MILQMNRYSGVYCDRCAIPIPVSAKVISLQDDIARGRDDAPQAFVARCWICRYESVYEIKRIQKFDGEPPKRKGQAQAA